MKPVKIEDNIYIQFDREKELEIIYQGAIAIRLGFEEMVTALNRDNIFDIKLNKYTSMKITEDVNGRMMVVFKQKYLEIQTGAFAYFNARILATEILKKEIDA